MKNKYTVITLAAVMGVCSANAAQTAQITLQGAVGASAAITVTGVEPYKTLNLETDQTDLKVATVNEKCNKHNGYTVTLASARAVADGGTVAKLVGVLPKPESLTYTMKYAAEPVTLVGGIGKVTDANEKTGGSGVNKDLTISYLGKDANLAADTYSDTLTLTIASR